MVEVLRGVKRQREASHNRLQSASQSVSDIATYSFQPPPTSFVCVLNKSMEKLA